MAGQTTTLRLRIPTPQPTLTMDRRMLDVIEACERHGVEIRLRL